MPFKNELVDPEACSHCDCRNSAPILVHQVTFQGHIIITVCNSSCGKVMFLNASVIPSIGGGGACVAGCVCGRGDVWQGGSMHGRGDMHGRGVCMAGGVHSVGVCMVWGCA